MRTGRRPDGCGAATGRAPYFQIGADEALRGGRGDGPMPSNIRQHYERVGALRPSHVTWGTSWVLRTVEAVMTARPAGLRKPLVPGVLASVLVAVALVAGCGASTQDASPRLEEASGSIIPSASLTDWVGFAHQVSVISVLSERERPLSQEEVEEGFGTIGRELTVAIEDTVWAHSAQEAVAGELTVRPQNGWIYRRDDDRQSYNAGLWYEVGERYLVALIHHDGWGWAPLSDESSSFLLDDGGRVTANPDSSVNDVLVGKTASEVRDLLAGESPDPVAAKYAHLDPVSRAEAYLEEKHP